MNKTTRLAVALAIELGCFVLLTAFMAMDSMISGLVIMGLGVTATVIVAKQKSLTDALALATVENRTVILALGTVLVMILPLIFVKNPYIIHIFTMTWIFVLAAVGLDMQVGAAGMVNFAQGSLMGIGGYTSALLVVKTGVSFWIGLPAGILMAGAWGLILGLPTLKTKEYHLSLVTIAFAYISYLMILNMKWTGGPDGIPGIPKPVIFGLSLARGTELFGVRLPGTFFYYYFALFFVGLGLVLAHRLRYSWVGLSWNAVRDDEIASKCYGLEINRAKLLVFVIGSMYAGASGVLLAHFLGFFCTENMAFSVGLVFVCMVILGGMDNLAGIVAGTFLLVIIPEKFRAFQDFRLLFYGVVLIMMLLFRPQGLFPNQSRKYSFDGELRR